MTQHPRQKNCENKVLCQLAKYNQVIKKRLGGQPEPVKKDSTSLEPAKSVNKRLYRLKYRPCRPQFFAVNPYCLLFGRLPACVVMRCVVSTQQALAGIFVRPYVLTWGNVRYRSLDLSYDNKVA